VSGAALTWIGHATVRLELDGAVLLTDPLLRSRIAHVRRIVPAPAPAATDGVDAVLLTHAHLDHLDLPSLRTLRPGLLVLAPPASATVLRRRTALDVMEVAAGTEVTAGGVPVQVVRAAHDGRRLPVGPPHEAVGYVVGRDPRVAVFGDTDLFDGMAALAGRVDVLVLPIWGWGPRVGAGHLDPQRAARAVALVQPQVAVPVHWGTFASPGVRWRADPSGPARRFAALAGDLAPAVRVCVLEPGGRLEL
jgi:L-ascorbate metabolism protein UlaG (beta-lactamase superfamily)